MKENIVLLDELLQIVKEEKEQTIFQLSTNFDKIIEKLNKKRELEYKKVGEPVVDADFTLVKDDRSILDPLGIDIS